MAEVFASLPGPTGSGREIGQPCRASQGYGLVSKSSEARHVVNTDSGSMWGMS